MRRLPFCTLAARERLASASHSLPSSPNERNGGDTIAIYHCSIKIVSRGKGKSAVAAAAYRSGEKLTNEWDGLTHDYTKKGGVVHSEILLPAHAPPAFSDRSTLWNSVELSEKSNNAQLAREVEIALPVELSREEQTRLVWEYCSSQFVSKGMIADFNLHDTGGGNPHAHILLTMRPLDEKGAWLPKSKKEYVLDENGEKIRLPSGRYKTRKVDLVDWNNRENAEVWRRAWADLANEFLAQNDRPERIDHRSHAARGMDELPTVHMGVAASQMEKKGVATDKGEINRMIRKTNRIIREIRGYIDELREWLAEVFRKKKELQAAPRSPDIATLLTKYLSVERERSRKYSVSWQQKHSASELQKISRAIVYLQAKGVATLDDLDAALSSVDGRAKALNESVKTKEGRMKKLQKLIEQGGHYNRFKPVHDELKTLKNGWDKKREKFEQEHESDLIIWNAANRYLHANLPEGTRSLDIPGWQREYLEKKGLSIEKENYAAVYAGGLDRRGDTQDRLDELYETFNIRRPEGFKGHSLSVSDIVALKQNGVVSCHYVDSWGFKALPDFLKPENYLKNAEMAMEDDYGMIDGVINNGPKQTVAELEEQAKSGKPVSLMELAQAARREQAQASRQEKKPSVLAKLCPPVNEPKKTARSKRAERELL